MTRNRAKAFEIWEDVREEMHITREELAKRADVNLKWLNDFINTGIFAEQVARIKRIEHILQIHLGHSYYECKRSPNLRTKE